MLHACLVRVWKDMQRTGHFQGYLGASVRKSSSLYIHSGSVECPIMCLHYFFKISLWGWLPGSAIAVEGLRAFPPSEVLPHRIDLRSLAPHGFQERTVSRGPTAKVCFQLPDNPRHFLWHRILAIDPPVSLPPSLPGDPSCVRPCAWPQGGTIHTFIKAMSSVLGM